MARMGRVMGMMPDDCSNYICVYMFRYGWICICAHIRKARTRTVKVIG